MEHVKLDFRGFDSDEATANEEVSCSDPKMSEFRRNLPGLPSNNDDSLHLANDLLVSCVAISASGPLEDSTSEAFGKTDSCEQGSQVNENDVQSNVVAVNSKEETLDKSRQSKHSSSRHRSSRDCRRCNERRKLKRCNVGVQCRIDKHLEKSCAPQFSLSKSLHSSSRVPCWDIHKYASLIHVEINPNGEASVLHMYQDEIDRLNLSEKENRELAEEFLKVYTVLSSMSSSRYS